MLTYIARRILYSIPVMFLSTFLSFVFVSYAGNPLGNLRSNPKISQNTLHLITIRNHLDRPVPVRYWFWLQDVVTHKLGKSLLTFQDRKSTRLNSSHVEISYAVFCLKKKST